MSLKYANIEPMYFLGCVIDVYVSLKRVGDHSALNVSKVLYQYHKTDISIILKWQINDTLKILFMMVFIG